jgi:hypothetical protein
VDVDSLWYKNKKLREILVTQLFFRIKYKALLTDVDVQMLMYFFPVFDFLAARHI